MKKRFNTWANYLLFGIVCLYIIMFFLPLRVEPSQLKTVESNGKGETYFVISPNGTLVGWGWNDYDLVANGNLLFYPYLARKTILRDIVDVDIGYRSAMAVDKNGTLWAWGSFPTPKVIKKSVLNRPIKIMDDVMGIELEFSFAASLKNDGSLWIWGEKVGTSIASEPKKIMDNVQSIYASSYNLFAIQNNNNLYACSYSNGDMVRSPELIATGIKDVSVGFQNQYQLLTTDGKLLLYSDNGYEDRIFTPINTPYITVVDNVQTLCDGGLIKNDDSYWHWQESENGEMMLVKQQDNVANAVGSVIIIKTDGKIYAEAAIDKLPTIPQSMRTVSPVLRNLFILVLLTKLIVNKYFRYNN